MWPKLLTANYPVQKHLFLIPRLALRLIGFYPETEGNVHVKLWAAFNFVVLLYGCYAELYFGLYNLRTDIASALDAFCPVASSIMSLIKIASIWWYRDDFKYLIETTRFLMNSQNSMEKTEVKRRYFTLTTRFSVFLMVSGLVTSTTFSLRPILMNLFRYLNAQPILYETPFKMMFPPSFVQMPIYPLTFILTHWHGYITVLSFVGADGFFLAFCIYFAVLLKILALDLTTILKDMHNVKWTTDDEICRGLVKIIERHNEIIDLSSKFTHIMTVITLGHFVTSSAIIGMSVTDILLFSGYGLIVYVIYTLAALTEICMYCIGGTAITENSTEIATIAYCSEWYSHSLRIQKMVLLIIRRAQCAIAVRVPFFAPSLPTLTSILRFTGSLIALAKSVL